MSQTFCPIPWIFQGVRSNGDLRICCQANISENQGLLKDQGNKPLNAMSCSLEKARNASLIKEVRKSMLQGKWHPTCVRCQQEERSGLNSRRIYENEQWPFSIEKAQQLTQNDGTIETSRVPIQYYDLRFGNLCNLACRMCGPTDSSSWYNDWVALYGKKSFKDSSGEVTLSVKNGRFTTNQYDWHSSESFWQQLEQKLDHIKHIYMAGGEPLLIEKHYDFLSQCIEKNVSQSIILEYNTNLTILPDKVLGLWKQFKEVRVGASIDGFGEVLEYQRYPAKWHSLYKNLVKLSNQPSNILSWLACTVTIYNAFHLPEFMRWKLKDDALKNINRTKRRPIITHHMAHNPKHLNIRNLPQELKHLVVDLYQSEIEKMNESNYPKYIQENFQSILESVSHYMVAESYHDQYWNKFLDHTKKLDKLRGQSISKTIKEFSQFF